MRFICLFRIYMLENRRIFAIVGSMIIKEINCDVFNELVIAVYDMGLYYETFNNRMDNWGRYRIKIQ